MRTLWQHLRFSLRLARKSPGFTALAVLTLALGIAASTTVYTWLDGMVLHPFRGVEEDQRLAILETVITKGKTDDPDISFLDYRDFRDNLRLISGLALRQTAPASIGEGEKAQRVWGELVSGNYFDVLGVKPLLGRVFSPEEYSDKPVGFLAVISHHLWRNAFQADPGIVGKTVRVNRQQVTIIGVTPPEFRGITPGLAFDLWVPLVREAKPERGKREFGAIARLKPGVSIDQAHAEVVAVAHRLAELYPDSDGRSARLVPIWKATNWGGSGLLLAPLRILGAACALVLLIGCANVANLLLSRSTARQQEFGIRVMLGASARRLAGQLLTESLLLAGLATLTSLLLVLWMANALVYFLPPTSLPLFFEIPLNGRIVAFALAICAATTVASGLPPILQSLRADLSETLKKGGRSGRLGVRSHRIGNLLVISEVCLAVVAMVGAGLFLRSFHSLRNISPGFDPNNVLVSRLYLATSDYTPEQEKQFCLRLRNRLAPAQGISAVSYADNIPLGFGLMPWDSIEVEGYAPARGENMIVHRSSVAPGYLDLLRIPLVAGRDFTVADGASKSRVMIVNESFVRRYFEGRNPIGRRVRQEGPWFTVIGVAKDSKYSRLEESSQPFFYMSFDQVHGGSGNLGVAFYVRTHGDARSAVRLLRREMAAIDPKTGGFEAMPLADYIGAAWFALKLATTLLSMLSAMALLLAAVGLYGVMAYAVSQRTQEIGIRMALGARPRDVLSNVVRRGMALTIIGIAAGTCAALVLTRPIAGMLVHVSATDPATIAGAVLFLTLVALLASYLPARRATKTDPMAALRCQ